MTLPIKLKTSFPDLVKIGERDYTYGHGRIKNRRIVFYSYENNPLGVCALVWPIENGSPLTIKPICIIPGSKILVEMESTTSKARAIMLQRKPQKDKNLSELSYPVQSGILADEGRKVEVLCYPNGKNIDGKIYERVTNLLLYDPR